MRYILFFFSLVMVTASNLYAEENWYNFLKPYRLNIGLSNDQIWLYTSLDPGLHYYEGSSLASDKTSEDAKKWKNSMSKKNRGSIAGISCPTRERNDESIAGLFATKPLPDISIETKSAYIWAGLGFNLGIGYVNTKSILVDYPTKNEESEFDLSIIFLSPSIFMFWGTENLEKIEIFHSNLVI